MQRKVLNTNRQEACMIMRDNAR